MIHLGVTFFLCSASPLQHRLFPLLGAEAILFAMITPKSVSLTALLLSATTNAQVYQTGGRSEDAFSWIQPEDTIILDQYNSSEPVYPSRKLEASQVRWMTY